MNQNKTLSRIVGEGTVLSSGSSFITKIIGLVILFLVLSRLSIYEYGLAKLALSLVPLLSFLKLPGMDTVLITDIAREKGLGNLSKAKALFIGYFRLQLILAFVAWFILFFGAEIVDLFYEGQITFLIRIISFSFIFSVFRTIITSFLSTELEFKNQSLFSILEELSKLILLIIIFSKFNFGPAGFVFAIVFASLIPILFFSGYIYKYYKSIYGSVKKDSTNIFEIIKLHGKWAIALSYLNEFGKNIRLWIIKFMIGTEAVAIFSVAVGFYSNTTGLFPFNSVLSTVIPRFLNDKKRFFRIIRKSIKYQFAVLSILGVFSFLVFPPVINIIFPQYIDSVILFKVMLISLLGVSFTSIFTIIFNSLKQQKSLFSSIAIKTIFTIIFAPIFIYFFGIVGVAIEFVLSVFVMAIDRFIIVKKIFPTLKLFSRDFWSFDVEDKIFINKISKTLLKTNAFK